MRDHASKFKGLIWVAAACLLGMTCALGLSPLAHAIPWSWEQKLGAALDTGVQNQCSPNAQAEALLQRLVHRLYPVYPEDADFSIEVRVARSPVVNAYAALGGNITVNSGLLKQARSPEELAGVLAHEITHVHRRHIMEGALAHMLTSQGISALFGEPSTAQWANYFLNMDFTRAQERQADQGGLMRLQRAHVDNRGFKDFFERMEDSSAAAEFLSDHPSNRARIAMVEQFANANTAPIMTSEEWKIVKNYCGGP